MNKINKILKLIIIIILFPTILNANTNFFDEGVKFFNIKKFDKAKFKFEQDLVYNPKNENAYLYLSKIFNFQKKNDLEEQNLDTVILINPKNEEALYNLAKLKLKQSDYKESKKLVNKLISICKNFCLKSEELKVDIEKSLSK